VTFATSEIACFLQEILPPETSRIPGSLRYAIARALLEVDAPPFDSVAEFSETLARYERGNRAARVIAVLDRARAALAPPGDKSPTPVVDRRRDTPEGAEGPQIHGNTRIEIIWTAIPAVALLVLAIFTFSQVPAVQANPHQNHRAERENSEGPEAEAQRLGHRQFLGVG